MTRNEHAAGHPARAHRRRLTVAAVTAAVLGAASALVVNVTPTAALMTSTAEPQVNTIHVGTWGPQVPAECGDVDDYPGGIVYGTAGDDTIDAGNQGEIVFGLGGDDTIYGGNAKDCLIGGNGDDTIYGGKGKDILIGGPGDDYLDGGNGKDVLDGGGDPVDVCIGGNAPTTFIGCASMQASEDDSTPAATTESSPTSAPGKS